MYKYFDLWLEIFLNPKHNGKASILNFLLKKIFDPGYIASTHYQYN
jgi:hypothetical protein